MFRKVEQNGRIKITHHIPGDYAIEPNPKRQKIPDFKRIIVNPVVNGLKVNIVKAPERVVKFDIVERPIGYQSMTPTPRTLTNMSPMVQVSEMLQAARIEKLQIEAPDKANVDFWKTYQNWTPGLRIPTLMQAIDDGGGQVNLVPIEINPLSISKWDWAVWFLSTMVTQRLIKKYQQTTVQLLKLFFETAQTEDVAQMTVGTVNVVPGWVFDEFSIVKRSCQQLDLPREPEPYGFEAPFKVLPQEFANKMLQILLYLTANAISSQVEYISSYNSTPLKFTEVKTMMQNPLYRLDILTRQIEDNPNPTAAVASASPGTTGETPFRMGPNAKSFATPAFERRTGAPKDFYEWEGDLADLILQDNDQWDNDYESRKLHREQADGADLNWFTTLFFARMDPFEYAAAVGREGLLSMRAQIQSAFGKTGSTAPETLKLVIAEVLHGAQDFLPITEVGAAWQPLPKTMLVNRLERLNGPELSNLLAWIRIVNNRFDPTGNSQYDRLMQDINGIERPDFSDGENAPNRGSYISAASSRASFDSSFRSPLGNNVRQREQERNEQQVPSTGRRLAFATDASIGDDY